MELKCFLVFFSVNLVARATSARLLLGVYQLQNIYVPRCFELIITMRKLELVASAERERGELVANAERERGKVNWRRGGNN